MSATCDKDCANCDQQAAHSKGPLTNEKVMSTIRGELVLNFRITFRSPETFVEQAEFGDFVPDDPNKFPYFTKVTFGPQFFLEAEYEPNTFTDKIFLGLTYDKQNGVYAYTHYLDIPDSILIETAKILQIPEGKKISRGILQAFNKRPNKTMILNSDNILFMKLGEFQKKFNSGMIE
jgi:hypothetical protein